MACSCQEAKLSPPATREVFDGLDPTSREIFKKCLIEFIAESPKHKVVIASHSLRELQDICDSFCLINDGLLEEGFSEASQSSKLHKVRLAFAEVIPLPSLSELHILHSAADGRFLTLIVEGEEKDISAKLAPLHPLVMDISSLSLEEAFIYKTGEAYEPARLLEFSFQEILALFFGHPRHFLIGQHQSDCQFSKRISSFESLHAQQFRDDSDLLRLLHRRFNGHPSPEQIL
jgi:energy-coupling factor transporter ATP-binding protein EcfA2